MYLLNIAENPENNQDKNIPNVTKNPENNQKNAWQKDLLECLFELCNFYITSPVLENLNKSKLDEVIEEA